MKSKNKKAAEKTKSYEKSVRLAGRSESEILCNTTATTRTTVESKSSSSEDNEKSGIEAELPIDVKGKIILKNGGVIEIDKKRYTVDRPIKGDYGVVGLMEKGNTKALFALHYEAQNCKIKRLQYGETVRDLHDRFGEFSVATSLKLSYLAIECIEELHKIGFIHRDIKPSVFAIGLEAEGSQLFLLGFGLARRYKKKRKKVHRMGNIRYMSRSSHNWMERSRKDDLESWLYMVVEFFLTASSLPWEDEKNHDKVLKGKEAFMNNDYQKIFKKCKGLPTGLNTIVRQLNTFQYETTPDYHLIKNIFKNAIIQGNYKSEKLDWLKGKEGEMLRAGACESKIFGEKSEREKEASQRSQRKEYDLRPRSNNEQRSVLMIPDANHSIGEIKSSPV
uniref:Protein kinase domain-containing protein n=1 Tax=Setaria digitata TaxID=48799 RepID=A0A915PJF3_9BILA